MPFRLSGPESDGRYRYDVCPSDDKLSVGCLHVLLFHSPADLFVDLIASVDYPFRHGRDDSVLHVLLYPAGIAEAFCLVGNRFAVGGSISSSAV